MKEKWVQAVSVGIAMQKRLLEISVCTLCGNYFSDGSKLSKHAAHCQPSSNKKIEVAPEEVVQWLRALPDRKKAMELAKKGLSNLSSNDKKQWDGLQETARQEKRRTLMLSQSSTSALYSAVSSSSEGPLTRKSTSPPMLNSNKKEEPGKRPSSPRRQTTAATSTKSKPIPSISPVERVPSEEAFVVYSSSFSPRNEDN
jgi:hypothetical protein